MFLLRLLIAVFCILSPAALAAQPYNLATQQMGRDALPDYFVDQAKAGLPIALPTLIPNSNSAKGHIGKFRRSVGPYQIRYRVSQQLTEGTLFFADRSFFVSAGGNAPIERGQQEPPRVMQTKTEGPYLLASDQYRHLPDDASFMPEGVWEITGTHQYMTVLGSKKTVWKIESSDASDINIPEDPRLLLSEPRQWSDRSGKFQTQAVYLGYNQGTVRMLKVDGKEIDVKLKQLSDEDRKFVREKILEAKAAEEDTSPGRR